MIVNSEHGELFTLFRDVSTYYIYFYQAATETLSLSSRCGYLSLPPGDERTETESRPRSALTR